MRKRAESADRETILSGRRSFVTTGTVSWLVMCVPLCVFRSPLATEEVSWSECSYSTQVASFLTIFSLFSSPLLIVFLFALRSILGVLIDRDV